MNNRGHEHRSTENTPSPDEEYRDIVLLWIFRIFARTRARQTYLLNLRPYHDVIAPYIGCDIEGKRENQDAWGKWIDEKLQSHEEKSVACAGFLFENIRKLSAVLGLTPVEQEILGFRALYRSNDALHNLLNNHVSPLTDDSLARLLGVALNRSQTEILTVLSAEGALVRSGLIRTNQCIETFQNKMGAMPGLLNALLREHRAIDDLIRFATRRAAPAALTAEDFPHCEKDLQLLKRYLAAARQEELFGVNVLIHGRPGVGKTEFVRLIAQELGMALYEVSMTNDMGLAMGPGERYSAYLFNQRFFAATPGTLILFDEIEDVIPHSSRMADPKGTLGYDKAWVNRLLETNPVPAFWVANRIEHMDPAYLRRFDYVIEMRNPPRSVRRRITGRYLEGLPVSEPWLERQAEREGAAPATIEKSARVVRHSGLTGTEEVERHFERILQSSVEAQGGRSEVHYPGPGHYRIEYLNTSVDVGTLPESLQKVRRGRILLHGAPGTGKTAFAHYLAKELDWPLMVRRASDLQSMYVGETEKNIARMFRDASDEGAVLLLDEADSFLQNRQQAVRSWEVSQVNELLTQMECYEGIFLCATNFMDHLDVASLRRFGLKVRFDYLTTEQRYVMFEELYRDLGDGPLDNLADAKARKALGALANLAPGDFAAVRQRCEMLAGPMKAAEFLDALREESAAKPDGQKRTIGFAN